MTISDQLDIEFSEFKFEKLKISHSGVKALFKGKQFYWTLSLVTTENHIEKWKLCKIPWEKLSPLDQIRVDGLGLRIDQVEAAYYNGAVSKLNTHLGNNKAVVGSIGKGIISPNAFMIAAREYKIATQELVNNLDDIILRMEKIQKDRYKKQGRKKIHSAVMYSLDYGLSYNEIISAVDLALASYIQNT